MLKCNTSTDMALMTTSTLRDELTVVHRMALGLAYQTKWLVKVRKHVWRSQVNAIVPNADSEIREKRHDSWSCIGLNEQGLCWLEENTALQSCFSASERENNSKHSPAP